MIYRENVWYGPYGGCFIADAFTLSCDEYWEQFRAAAADEGFVSAYHELRRAFPGQDTCFEENKAGNTAVCCTAGERGPLLGTALLAKRLGKSALFGARYADEALLCAQVCAYLNVPVHIFLGRELAGIRTLTDRLTLLGAAYDTKMCAELFDLPEMYAFQAWVSAPAEKQLLNCRSNVGAFPQTNIAAAFAAEEGKELVDAAFARLGRIERVVLPVVSGTLALAVASNLAEGCQCVCVECDTEQELTEELDSYCGAFTRVMRNRFSDRVLAPELMELADQGRVVRVHITPEEAVRARSGRQLSLQSLAALRYCETHPVQGRTLCVVRPVRWGAAT